MTAKIIRLGDRRSPAAPVPPRGGLGHLTHAEKVRLQRLMIHDIAADLGGASKDFVYQPGDRRLLAVMGMVPRGSAP